MLRVEDRQFQRVDHTADGIDDAAGEKPCESGRCESGNDLADRHDAYPAHRDVDHGGDHFGQLIQRALMMMPTMAMPQTRDSIR